MDLMVYIVIEATHVLLKIRFIQHSVVKQKNMERGGFGRRELIVNKLRLLMGGAMYMEVRNIVD